MQDRRSSDAMLTAEEGIELNVSTMPEHIRVRPIAVGDVYRNQRGALLVVCAVRSNGDVCLLMFNETGGIIGVERYGAHSLREKVRIGRCLNLPTMLEVEWN